MKTIIAKLVKFISILLIALVLGMGSAMLTNSTSSAKAAAPCPQNYCPEWDTFYCPSTHNWVKCYNAGDMGCFHSGC